MPYTSDQLIIPYPDHHGDIMPVVTTEAQRSGTGNPTKIAARQAIFQDLFDQAGIEITIAVMRRLGDAPIGINDLAREANGASEKKIAIIVRHLVKNGFAVRRNSDTFPSYSRYALTPLGMRFLAQINELIHWISGHSAEIQSARANFQNRSFKWLRPGRGASASDPGQAA